MKIFAALSLLATAMMMAPSAVDAQAVGTPHIGANNTQTCDASQKLFLLTVTVTFQFHDDNTFEIHDRCARRPVNNGPITYGEMGVSKYYYCLNPMRVYNFQITDLEPVQGVTPPGPEGPDSWVLKWDDTMIAEQGVIYGNDDHSVNFGATSCNLPSAVPNTRGDPHFKTLTGRNFDFHGACDLLMFAAPNFANGLGLEAHIRTKSRYQYSFVSAAAVKLGEDILEVGSYGQVIFNGVDSVEFPLSMGDGLFSVTQVRSDKKNHIFEIDLGETEMGSNKIVLKTFKDLVSVMLPEDLEQMGEGYYGMMGQFNTKMDMVDRTGTKLITDANEYGLEWQVRDTDPILFANQDHFPQYPEKCVMPSISSEERRRLGEMTISEEQAKRACEVAGRGHDASDLDACIFDVIATGDLEMANAGAF